MFHIRKKKKLVKTKSPLWQQLPKAIVYLSDVFIFLMVATWIFYIVNGTFAGWYELIVVQSTCIFTDLKDACTIPLTAGGVVWLIRCAVNHLNAAKNGEMLKYDFPNLDEDGNILIADEMLTPDSSRFWPLSEYEVGHSEPSFDKQFARDWLKANPDNNWTLPQDVADKTIAKYLEAYKLLTGKEL